MDCYYVPCAALLTCVDTVVTCFDRRWEKGTRNFQCNIVDKLLMWTLPQQASRIHNGYDLTHLLINETSGFFFNYSSTLEPEIRFHEIFRFAISSLVRSNRISLRPDHQRLG
jgi:hypothetical protein